ncbi:MAG: ABC transporter ATP-binding protein [Phycisphaeraceae bacterium]
MSPPPDAPQPPLRTTELTIGLADRPLLSVTALRVEAGELLALQSPSGGGKTTLLRTLAGLIDPLDGTVYLQGQTGDKLGWPAFRSRMPLVTQQPVLSSESVAANLARPLSFRAAGGQTLPRQRAAELLDRLGLSAEVLDRPARELSVGQQQRVSLVRALLLRPAVVLLDEPTAALDAAAADRMGELLQHLAEHESLAAVIASHDAGFADRWCHRRIELPRLEEAS